MISVERLWRTADGTIVPDGHPDAAFLVAGVGSLVPSEHQDAVKAYRAPVADKGYHGDVVDKVDEPPAPLTKKAASRRTKSKS